ncbi:MAG: dTMP kinase [Nanoarchaeota archaeon]|nr:dTMP kinase [Nanoarchaeota archaeon]MBU1988449.1 dTMP kinase [Nanoarchaeota archaeon]
MYKRGHRYKGVFVTFEGGEGSGKGIQISLLKNCLSNQGYIISIGRCSGGTPIGERIRNILQNPKVEPLAPRTELLLYMASRAQSTEEIVIPTLKEGGICIYDRFGESSRAYQGGGLGLNRAVIDFIQDFATESIIPDLTFFIDLASKTGLERMTTNEFGQPDKIESRPLSYHKRVRRCYLQMAQAEPDRIKVIPYQSSNPHKMHQQIRQEVDNFIKHFKLREKLLRR